MILAEVLAMLAYQYVTVASKCQEYICLGTNGILAVQSLLVLRCDP